MNIFKKFRTIKIKERSNNEIYDKLLENNKKIDSLYDKKIKELGDLVIDVKARKIAEYEKVIDIKTNESKAQKEIIDALDKENGKLKKENSTLKEENIDLIDQIEDLQSDRWLARELPAEKAKITKKMEIKRSQVGSGAKAILRKKNEERNEVEK